MEDVMSRADGFDSIMDVIMLYDACLRVIQ